MIYIHTALKSEAQAFVDKFKLRKSKLNNFTILSNHNMTLIISGVGIQNTIDAINLLITNFNIKQNDIFLNIGICGASKNFNIGDIIEISSIVYKDNFFELNQNTKNTLHCLDYECCENIYEIVDMESFGFYEALKNITNVKMFKIVSDHFQPKTLTKEKTKSLIFNKMEQIIEKSSYNWSE